LPDAHGRSLAREFAAFDTREPGCCQRDEFDAIIAELIAAHGYAAEGGAPG
jgi:hypothetical protein